MLVKVKPSSTPAAILAPVGELIRRQNAPNPRSKILKKCSAILNPAPRLFGVEQYAKYIVYRVICLQSLNGRQWTFVR